MLDRTGGQANDQTESADFHDTPDDETNDVVTDDVVFDLGIYDYILPRQTYIDVLRGSPNQSTGGIDVSRINPLRMCAINFPTFEMN